MVQLVNAGEHILYVAIIHDDVISWICAAIAFLLVWIYFVVYWIYASREQKKRINVRRVSVIVIMGLLIRIVVILNIIPFLKGVPRDVVNAVLFVVISSPCSFYVPISFVVASLTALRGSSWKTVPLVMQIMQIFSCFFLLYYAQKMEAGMSKVIMMITNIVGFFCAGMYMIFWSIFVLYILCGTTTNKEVDFERDGIPKGTGPSSLLQNQPESVTPLPPPPHCPVQEKGSTILNMESKIRDNFQDQNIGTRTELGNDLMSGTDVLSRHTSSETQNESAPDMQRHKLDTSASAPASSLSTLSNFPAKEEGAAPTSVESTLSSNLNLESETPTNLQDQTLATPTGSSDDHKSTTAALSAPDMKRHELDPSASALVSPLPPLPHSPAKEESAAPTSVYSAHSSIPNVESETPTNLKDQTLATPTGSADDRKSAAAVNSSLASSETQNQSAPHIKRPILDGDASTSALASTSSQLHHSTKEGNAASPSFLLPVSTITEHAPFVDGPSPYQGLHGQAEGGLLGAPPKSFTLTAPA